MIRHLLGDHLSQKHHTQSFEEYPLGFVLVVCRWQRRNGVSWHRCCKDVARTLRKIDRVVLVLLHPRDQDLADLANRTLRAHVRGFGRRCPVGD